MRNTIPAALSKYMARDRPGDASFSPAQALSMPHIMCASRDFALRRLIIIHPLNGVAAMAWPSFCFGGRQCIKARNRKYARLPSFDEQHLLRRERAYQLP